MDTMHSNSQNTETTRSLSPQESYISKSAQSQFSHSDDVFRKEKAIPIYCRYSGMPLPTYQDFPSLPIKFDSHILMRAPFWMLIEEINKRKNLTIRQNRLLFVALLKSTDLCIFNHPAIPSDRIIEIEFPRLLAISYYIHGHRSFYLTFPRFAISRENMEISNISHVITDWEDIKAKHVITKDDRLALLNIHAQEELERKVTKAIIQKQPLTPLFNKSLIKWALEESDSPIIRQIQWAKIFLTKEDKLCRMCYGKKLILNLQNSEMEKCPNCNGKGRVSDVVNLKFTDVQLLRNYMIDNLPDSTSYEMSRKLVVLNHLSRKLQSIRILNQAFGILDEVPKTPEELALNAKAGEPKKEDFQNKIEYLRAIALFRAAQDIPDSLPDRSAEDLDFMDVKAVDLDSDELDDLDAEDAEDSEDASTDEEPSNGESE